MNTSLHKVGNAEIDPAYSAYMGVYDWLNAKGVRQWLRPLSKEVFAQRQRNGELFALRAGNRLVAVVTIAFETNTHWPEILGEDRHWWIKSVAVVREWSGAGVGNQVMAESEALARKTGASEIFLDCVDAGFLPPYYKRLGYATVGEKTITYPSGNSFPMVLMKKCAR